MSLGSLTKLLLGGNKQIFPTNDLIKSYNMDQSSLFKVTLSAFSQAEALITSNNGAIDVGTNVLSQPLGTFECIHNAEKLSLTHSHKYGENNSGLSGLVNDVFKEGGFGKTALKYANMTKGLINLVSEKKSSTPILGDYNTYASVDVAKIYKSTASPSFTTSFSLIASTDPLKEVVYPSLLFTYLSYPTLNSKKSLKIIMDLLVSTIDKGMGKLSSLAKNLPGVDKAESVISKKKAKTAVKTTTKLLRNTSKAITHVSKGKWRFRVGDSPPFWIVSSSNGLIYMPYALLDSVTVDYYGPWLGAPDEASFASFAKKVAGGKISAIKNPSEIFPSTSALGNFNPVKALKGLTGASLGGFPSYAIVTLNFIPALDQIFGEEWLLGMAGASNHINATSSMT